MYTAIKKRKNNRVGALSVTDTTHIAGTIFQVSFFIDPRSGGKYNRELPSAPIQKFSGDQYLSLVFASQKKLITNELAPINQLQQIHFKP